MKLNELKNRTQERINSFERRRAGSPAHQIFK
jgi:hypothetical protein